MICEPSDYDRLHKKMNSTHFKFVEKSHALVVLSYHLEYEGAIFEVLGLAVGIVVKAGVGSECVQSQSFSCPPTRCHFLDNIRIRCISKMNAICMTTTVLPTELVAQCDGDLALEWPLQIIIKDSWHQVDKHRYMGPITCSIPISIYPQTHSVATIVGVERRGVPDVPCTPVLLKFKHSEVN